ncbi:translocation and assembly module TamA [Rhizobium alvei]
MAFLLATTLLASPAAAFEIFGWKFFEKEADPAITDPLRYDVTLATGDKDIDEELQDTSALFQDRKDPVNGDLGLVIKARDDRDRLIARLYEDGRYGAVVKVAIDGTDIENLPAVPVFPRDRPVPVNVTVEPGPTFTIGNIHLTGDAARLDPAAYKLVPGGPAGSNLVINAANRMVADLEAEGRPLAKLTERNLVADHETNTVEITIGANGGPVADVGTVKAHGSASVDPEFVETWSRLEPGRRYSPEEIKDASERLRKLGVFSSVAITRPDRLSPDGTIPLDIALVDGKQRYFGVGAQFSSIDGFGFSGYWGHRNLFGKAESLKLSGSVSRLGETWDIQDLTYVTALEFSKPAIFDAYSTLNARLSAEAESPDSYRSKSLTAEANIGYDFSKIDTATFGVDLTLNQSEDEVYGQSRFLTLSKPVSWQRDASNDKLNPTSGYRFNLAATPSYEFLHDNFFTTLEGSVSAYQGLGSEDQVVLAAKLSAGTLLFAPDLADVPATRRFYAGGGGSVRGFGYQEITPYNADGEALGGRSYLLGSFETRIKVTDSVGLVPFIDVGSVTSSSTPGFSDFRAGAGIGLRYATPFGPLRLDVAMPLNPYPGGSRYGIYAGIGQSF